MVRVDDVNSYVHCIYGIHADSDGQQPWSRMSSTTSKSSFEKDGSLGENYDKYLVHVYTFRRIRGTSNRYASINTLRKYGFHVFTISC